MVKQPVSFEELDQGSFPGVEFNFNLPEFVDTENMFIYTRRLSLVSLLLGSKTLQITTEAGEVTRNHYGMYMHESDWGPSLGGTTRHGDTVSMVRTVEAKESEASRGGDWIILNTNEIYERIQTAEFLPRAFLHAAIRRREYIDRPWSYTWGLMMDKALRVGVGELTQKKLRRNPIVNLGGAALVRVKNQRRYIFGNGHDKFEDEKRARVVKASEL